MAYEQKDNTGSLFKNDKREKDTHAHARGSALIEGVEYFMDAWTNTDRNGNKYQSLKFKRKDQQHQQGHASRQQSYGEASGGRGRQDHLESAYGSGEDDGEVPW